MVHLPTSAVCLKIRTSRVKKHRHPGTNKQKRSISRLKAQPCFPSTSLAPALPWVATKQSLKVSSGNSVMVYSNYDLVVFGVHFVVEPGAELNFVANGDIVLERSEASLEESW